MITWRSVGALLALASLAQEPPPPAPDPILRITVTLVQIDAVVTDSRGRPVADLTADDFEVLQDGKPRKITHFSYVRTADDAPPRAASPKDAPASPLPRPPLARDQVKRTIALVVDDLGLSQVSLARVQMALRKYVREQVRTGDLVAIVSTGGGVGALQQFTSDPRVLEAAVQQLRFNFMSRARLSSLAAASDNPNAEPVIGDAPQTDANLDAFQQRIFAAGTLGAIDYVIAGMRELPGRKAAVVFSDGLPIQQNGEIDPRLRDPLLDLIDRANRAGVAFYTLDAKGLVTFDLTAADSVRNASNRDQLRERRQREFFDSAEGMSMLARDTGGVFFQNRNDIPRAIEEVMQDQSGYYLIGYSPESDTFTGKDTENVYRKTRVRVKRPGLTVRSRAGFYAKADEQRPAPPATREGQITAAMASPFAGGSLPLRLTSLYFENPKVGPYVYSMLHIGARDLHFTADPDGMRKAVLDIVTVTYGAGGKLDARTDRTYTIRLAPDKAETLRARGLVYFVNHPLKSAGAFQMRAVVRDAGAKTVGSATQFIEAPDTRKGRLALSGIVMKVDASKLEPGREGGDIAAEGSAALRRFHAAQAVTYAFQIFGAKGEDTVEWRAHIFRDGVHVHTTRPTLESNKVQPDPKRWIGAGMLKFGSAMKPGSYAIQIVATSGEGKKQRRAMQWIDFEVAP